MGRLEVARQENAPAVADPIERLLNDGGALIDRTAEPSAPSSEPPLASILQKRR